MDIATLLKLLNDHGVKFVIIGAMAFPPHGYVRATLDLDIFIEPTVENATKAKLAMTEFGYDVTALTIEQLLTTKVLTRGYIVQSDFHPFVAGVSDFQSIWDASIEGAIQGVPVRFADLHSLIAMKKAAGRDKDLLDLKYLEKLQTLKK